jgi:hypothetical protein
VIVNPSSKCVTKTTYLWQLGLDLAPFLNGSSGLFSGSRKGCKAATEERDQGLDGRSIDIHRRSQCVVGRSAREFHERSQHTEELKIKLLFSIDAEVTGDSPPSPGLTHANQRKPRPSVADGCEGA